MLRCMCSLWLCGACCGHVTGSMQHACKGQGSCRAAIAAVIAHSTVLHLCRMAADWLCNVTCAASRDLPAPEFGSCCRVSGALLLVLLMLSCAMPLPKFVTSGDCCQCCC